MSCPLCDSPARRVLSGNTATPEQRAAAIVELRAQSEAFILEVAGPDAEIVQPDGRTRTKGVDDRFFAHMFGDF